MLSSVFAEPPQAKAKVDAGKQLTNLTDLHGGLVVQLGASDVESAAALSKTGRYLIHVLDLDEQKAKQAQSQLHKSGFYGLTWAERQTEVDLLPYAENMVNMVVVRDHCVDAAELQRVVTPGGSVVVDDTSLLNKSQLIRNGFEVLQSDDSRIVARKPWPLEMDVWSHPRHASDGNAVSLDTLVGPPDRVRWIAAATSEVEGMVSHGGRNFYGGTLARDSFNGLRLWHRDLNRAGELDAAKFNLPKLARDGARPIASEQYVFAIMKNQAVAFNSATGEIAVEYGKIAKPTSIIHDGTSVIVADADSVHAFNTETGKEIWMIEAADPRNIIADGQVVSFIKGRVKRGEQAEAFALDAKTGEVKWHRDDYPWLVLTTRTVLAKGMLIFEVSTLNDHDDGNGIHVVSADTGEHSWSKNFPPGMNHARQARAMCLAGDLWILHGGKTNTSDKEKMARESPEISALDPLTGEVRKTYPAGLAHCFPPVATPNYMFAGELDMTDLSTGEVIANRITKANCSRESGWTPANGLVYTTPKHCTCWPMLRGFVAMAPAKPRSKANLPLDKMEFLLEKGTATVSDDVAPASDEDWPLYRQDRWRSGSSSAAGPKSLERRWTSTLQAAIAAQEQSADEIFGPILHDWNENPVVKGNLSPPTIAGGMAYVTRPNAHELIAIDTASGEVSWRFTANGRLDTPPAIHRGLCLFGTAAGWVYALRAKDGELVWRMRAAPSSERIVAYGPVESPWA
ncbi:MAG: PQQ-binding-like beta-propeller repeat protein, partial [Rubripirellula sp.]